MFISLFGFSLFMYSDRGILKLIDSGALKIIPFNKKNLQPDSYKIHLDSLVAIGLRGKVNPLKVRDYSKFFKKKRVSKDGFVLKPGDFILARTVEKFSIPLNVSGFITGRTGLARVGVSVVQTAPLIHSGHGLPIPRKIVLEISNSGPFDVVLSKGMVIGKIVFHRLETSASKAYDSIGRYGKRKDLNALLPLKE